ncbi:exodeoxyribonuclease VII large subunit [Rhodococcus coprophilus]|uniref:Exodeoxyribonuclease 7 large subunit n=1 Tax=Rhodococcus coprophilus TaxID=38310 RepID=A0A2X4U7Q9_9NOCA|nr:exodeoxyribonuclease VII large subunit [Rhodococcus coprophilus]MBM7457779.1 exodeoxyribonuclease VII large subunit [Rhodococcus coprophilus]SQI30402.1 exodeoxyribonuclease VII large subunit [Rhodococcus coprophilus]
MTAAQPAARPNSPENPWPVRTVSQKVAGWIDRLGTIWVEGQVTQINARPGTRTAFLTLRDASVDMSLPVTCSPQLLQNSPVPITEGSRVIMFGKLTYWAGRGTLSLRVTEIRAVGIGELLARIERLRSLLAAEGLFDPRLKRPLPFLPRRIGLITGRASAAERDVVSVAQRRWPAVQIDVRHATVQGPTAVPQILDALEALDADPAVDVIILARGGGSVEDLLPFSDEALCRAIVACTTPVVSAIGHEPDSPLSDHVADLRAATPTDAAKRVVPDAVAEQYLVDELRARSASALRSWVRREEHVIAQLRDRPVLADPFRALDRRHEEIDRLRTAGRRDIARTIAMASSTLEHMCARLSTLGPAATLARGYAVVQRVVPGGNPEVIRSLGEMPIGTQLRVRVADGAARAAVMGHEK